MKKILSLFLATLISLSLAIPAFATNATNPTYSDVPSSHWAYSYVEAVTSKGLFGGIGGGKFSPETPFTRAQISQVLYNAYSKTLTGTLDSNTAVNGLTGREWYKTPLRWALGYTLLDGTYYDMGSIYGASPNATVDRKCMALAMYRVALRLSPTLPILTQNIAPLLPHCNKLAFWLASQTATTVPTVRLRAPRPLLFSTALQTSPASNPSDILRAHPLLSRVILLMPTQFTVILT